MLYINYRNNFVLFIFEITESELIMDNVYYFQTTHHPQQIRKHYLLCCRLCHIKLLVELVKSFFQKLREDELDIIIIISDPLMQLNWVGLSCRIGSNFHHLILLLQLPTTVCYYWDPLRAALRGHSKLILSIQITLFQKDVCAKFADL